MAEEGSKLMRWNDLVLAGKSPVEAAKEAGYKTPESAAYHNLRRESVHERNAQMFEQIGLDAAAPYRVLAEAMLTATRTRKETVEAMIPVKDEKGNVVKMAPGTKDIYREVPDWPVRSEAALRIAMLRGDTPKSEAKVAIHVGGARGQVDIDAEVGGLLLQLRSVPDDEARLRLYNELKSAQREGPAGTQAYLDRVRTFIDRLKPALPPAISTADCHDHVTQNDTEERSS